MAQPILRDASSSISREVTPEQFPFVYDSQAKAKSAAGRDFIK